MIKHIIALTFFLALTACATTGTSTDSSSSDTSSSAGMTSVIMNDAMPVYEACLKEYEKTMSNEEAKAACTAKLKETAVKTLM
jgi:hypothetical protein